VISQIWEAQVGRFLCINTNSDVRNEQGSGGRSGPLERPTDDPSLDGDGRSSSATSFNTVRPRSPLAKAGQELSNTTSSQQPRRRSAPTNHDCRIATVLCQTLFTHSNQHQLTLKHCANPKAGLTLLTLTEKNS